MPSSMAHLENKNAKMKNYRVTDLIGEGSFGKVHFLSPMGMHMANSQVHCCGEVFDDNLCDPPERCACSSMVHYQCIISGAFAGLSSPTANMRMCAAHGSCHPYACNMHKLHAQGHVLKHTVPHTRRSTRAEDAPQARQWL